MKISTVHQKFSEYLQNSDALENPQDYLGPNYLSVLNFWLWLDTLTADQWKEVSHRYDAIPYAALCAARVAARNAVRNAAGVAALDAARNAARNAAEYAAREAAREAARYAAWKAAWLAARDASEWATVEIMGAHNLIEKGTLLTFVPIFNDL